MKRHAPAAERNRGPIVEALREILPAGARVLEIGSGTGQHAAFVTRELPEIRWQPTEPSAATLESIEAYRQESRAAGFLPPVELDARSIDRWPAGPYDAVFAANVIHIAPWSVAEALVAGAARVLAAGGAIVLYGPFAFDGAFTAPSNAAFDRQLRARDPDWGVRDVDAIDRLAATAGFERAAVREMPANNHVIAYVLRD